MRHGRRIRTTRTHALIARKDKRMIIDQVIAPWIIVCGTIVAIAIIIGAVLVVGIIVRGKA
jgi:hypothetical protein